MSWWRSLRGGALLTLIALGIGYFNRRHIKDTIFTSKVESREVELGYLRRSGAVVEWRLAERVKDVAAKALHGLECIVKSAFHKLWSRFIAILIRRSECKLVARTGNDRRGRECNRGSRWRWGKLVHIGRLGPPSHPRGWRE